MPDSSFSDLIQLYSTMENEWDHTARSYDFHCNGCRDNCCTSLFYHHTHIEQAYLLSGFKSLPADKQKQIIKLAETYCEKTFSGEHPNESKQILCPANEDSLCLLYAYRPMICRLHGIPHELHRPGFDILKSPGCDAGNFEKHAYVPFDRTPYYHQMAQLEMVFRQTHGITGKTKQTVAQIILSDMK